MTIISTTKIIKINKLHNFFFIVLTFFSIQFCQWVFFVLLQKKFRMDIKELNVNIKKNLHNNHPWEYARAKVVMSLLKRYLKNNKLDCVIDIGCGDVFFLNQFCEKYTVNQPIAVDTAFDEAIISQLEYKDNAIILYDDIRKIDLQMYKANVVFIMDVMEHIEYDAAFLKEIVESDFVGPDTIFMITGPAYQKLFSSHDRFVGHYRRYTQKTLQNSIRSAGLATLDKGYFFTSLVPARIVQKLLEKIKGAPLTEPSGAGGWSGGRVISKLYEICLLFDFYFFRLFSFIGIKMPGLSAYSICKLTQE